VTRRSPEHASLVAVLILLGVFVLALGAAVVTASDRPSRDVGYGQVRFNGLGPERWAQRYRREHRRVAQLQRRLTATRHVLPAGGLVRDFLCIYGGENGGWGWSANTGNGYYGGLQMDMDFQRTWGLEFFKEWGTADRWPPEVQIAVGIRAYLHRGWSPWPNTSRSCGLR
jgi:hypothetical protein